jgi:hypothetical protein
VTGATLVVDIYAALVAPLIIIAVAEAGSTLYETDNTTALGATSADDSGSGA